ncbi:MAG: chemotaxis response regulator protein-glutamate methylesterase [Chthoniobacterales bacterium]|nr:chemotaxis response regulator protein-glutamate methylesterase [Chthoniobacterales bacterium]
MRKKVLVVDDSAVVRKVLGGILSTDPELEVIGAARDPFEAVEIIRRVKPDVITLDLEMPRMDGLEFLRRIMEQHPIPVVICSSLAQEGTETALQAMELGAVEVIAKPVLGTKEFFEESKVMICDAVKAAAGIAPWKLRRRNKDIEKKLTADAVLTPVKVGIGVLRETTQKVIVVGASTGGTEALKLFLSNIPKDSPGMVIVQHMPERFTSSFARRLDESCEIEVREAVDGDTVRDGLALIAPGGKHTILRRSGARYFVEVRDGPLVSRHRPSVDVLFRSAAQSAGRNAVGVILTGMGDDGARGMRELRDAGGRTFAQDEATCVVFGMPKEAIAKGGVEKVLPIEALPAAVLKACVQVGG